MMFNDLVGDYVIVAIIALLLVGAVGYLLYSMIAAPKGNWDDNARLRGAMRSKRWRSAESVVNLKEHLLGGRVATKLWPAADNAAGLLAVSANRETPSWRAGILVRPGNIRRILLTTTVRQRNDGATVNFSEALLRREESGWALFRVDELGRVSTAGIRPAYLTDSMVATIESWEDVESVHFIGEHITGVSTLELDGVEVLETFSRKIHDIAEQIPGDAWR